CSSIVGKQCKKPHRIQLRTIPNGAQTQRNVQVGMVSEAVRRRQKKTSEWIIWRGDLKDGRSNSNCYVCESVCDRVVLSGLSSQSNVFIGTRGRGRTCDLSLRRRTL